MLSLNIGAMLVGLVAVGYGLWLIYPPLSFIGIGAALLWSGLPD
ncbi:hypothetical protein [Thiohalobacter thiocyanaticus]|nr:hypothetical protein [Thiohalobacter thiocyanaticus]